MKKSIYFVLGQTAAGKTAFATNLAKENNGELINCDSRQIYKHLDIITGKTDNPKNMAVHCVDIIEPDQSYSAYEYARMAYDTISNIIERNKIPIVVGGTGMYAYLLKYFDPKKEYQSLTNVKYFDNYNISDLQKQIQSKYFFIWEKLNESDKKNKRRLSAALQRMMYITSSLVDEKSKNNLANIYNIHEHILLHKDQHSLELRLKQRVEERLRMGAIEECREILKMGFSENDPGLLTIGYQSIFKFLSGKITEATLREEWLIKERQYAKRQKTYFLKYFPSAEIIYV